MIEKKYLEEYTYMGERIYLDCSTMGMQPKRSIELAKSYVEDFALRLGRLGGKDNAYYRRECKKRIGELIKGDPEDIFFTDNTTQGNNLLTCCYPFEPGDEVILGNGDFPAVYMPWAGKQRDGVRLVFVENKDGIVGADDFIEKMTDKTKAVAISFSQSSSGYTADIKKLGQVCRQRGIILSVDGIQALGRLPVDVGEMNIDVLASSSFKGLLGMMGAGFCYCRKEIMDRIRPWVCSGNIDWDSFSLSEGFSCLPIPQFPPRAARMETGTVNNLGIAVMGESIGLLLEIGVEKIAARIREVESYYRKCLQESGLAVKMLGSSDPATWSGSISFVLPKEYREPLKEELDKAQIYAAVRDYFRVSLHYYNNESQIDRLMEVLVKVLPQKSS